jgi:hypothetical protein
LLAPAASNSRATSGVMEKFAPRSPTSCSIRAGGVPT